MGWWQRVKASVGSPTIARFAPTERGTARITGIGYGLSGDLDQEARTFVDRWSTLRLDWTGPDGEVTTWCRAWIWTPRFRVGAAVPIVHDGMNATVDPVTCERSAPILEQPHGEGMTPTSLLLGEGHRERSETWRPEAATVAGFAVATSTRRDAVRYGLAAWDVTVRRGSGDVTLLAADTVPACTQAYVEPGAEVPLLVHPDDPARVVIDHLRLVLDRAPHAGAWEDPLPPDSIAGQ